MKCKITKSCARKDWCCNFCTLKCASRCRGDHKTCTYFNDVPIEEYDDKGYIRLFKYQTDAKGNNVRHYYSLAELQEELERKQEERLCQKKGGKL